MPALELSFRALATPGWVTGVFVALVVLVTLAARSSRRALEAGEELPPPRALYPQLAVQLALVGIVAAFAARELGIDVWTRPAPDARAWAWGAAVLVAMLVSAVLLWRVTPPAERERRAALIPTTNPERALVLLVSCLAGVAEELAWRVALPAVLARWTGNAWLAIALSAGSFALAHAVQGRAAMLVVLAVALAFQGLIEVAGGLWVAVCVHAAYDSLVGLWLAPYLRRSGESA